GAEADRIFVGPQDVEWPGNGTEEFVLQSRPITVMGTAASAEVRQDWSNRNAGEGLPDVVSPMTRSLLEQTAIRIFETLLATLGFDLRDARLVGFIAGRIYFNLNTCVAMVRTMPGGRGLDGTTLFGGMHTELEVSGAMAMLEDNLPRVALSRVQLVRQVPKIALWWLRHLSAAAAQRACAAFVTRLDARHGRDVSTQPDAAVQAEINTCVELLRSELVNLGGFT